VVKLLCCILQRELEQTHSKNLLDEDDDESEEEVEELTHFGQSLSEMENFKDPVLSDVDDDSDDGRINGNVFVSMLSTYQ
jgi:hypothetical protein